MGQKPLHEVRKVPRKKQSENMQIVLAELDVLKSRLVALDTEKKMRLHCVMVLGTDNGESGTTRTYEIPGLKTQHSAMAISCASGASPATVKGATCSQGSVTVYFDIDPSTDHKVSLWVARPDKTII